MIDPLKLLLFTCTLTWRFNDIECVVYGKVASLGQFKYQVLLKTRKAGEFGLCAGAIVSEWSILTAWHCVYDVRPEDIQVTVGAVLYEKDPHGVSHRISDVRLHRSRTCRNGELRCYDIAMLTTSEPMAYSPYVDEVLLPRTDYEPGRNCVFAGWGLTEYHPLQPSPFLRYGFGRTLWVASCKYFLTESLNDYEFCFTYLGDDPSSIHSGDSGAPLVCDGVLTGIVVRGGGPSLYPVTAINVYSVLDFVYGVEMMQCPYFNH